MPCRKRSLPSNSRFGTDSGSPCARDNVFEHVVILSQADKACVRIGLVSPARKWCRLATDLQHSPSVCVFALVSTPCTDGAVLVAALHGDGQSGESGEARRGEGEGGGVFRRAAEFELRTRRRSESTNRRKRFRYRSDTNPARCAQGSKYHAVPQSSANKLRNSILPQAGGL